MQKQLHHVEPQRGQVVLVFAVLRMILGAMWVVSAGLKLWDLDAFVRDVRNYKFPLLDVAPGDMLLGYGLPWLELIVGVVLIIGFCNKACYILSAGMFTAFITAIGYAKYHGLQIHCGCFGSGGSAISSWHFVGLVAGIVYIIFLWFTEANQQLEPEGNEE